MKKLTHVDEQGKAKMVDITEKPSTVREAKAKASVYMKPDTMQLIIDRKIPKGDVLCVAKIAGIMGAKNTASLIPMCHPLNITSIDINFELDEINNKIDVISDVKIIGKTGVEIESLIAVTISALTIYDMCKAVDKEMTISDIMLLEKKGGKSGTFKRNG
jgi:cyclic pyranopterin phosphate synthase